MNLKMLRRREGKSMRNWQGYVRGLRSLCAFRNADSAGRGGKDPNGEQGSSLVEMAVSSAIFLATFIGVFELCISCYAFHFVSDAAREGSRYAMVRGSNSCTYTPNLPNCNVTSAQVQTYIQNLGYPGLSASDLTATTTWLTVSAAQPATWSTCTSGTCNAPGNQVQVAVTYAFPLSIPFWKNGTLTVNSTSRMVIAQ